jgi:large subunit ribosomal protein L33
MHGVFFSPFCMSFFAERSLCFIREVLAVMAKSKKREYIWLECKECGDRNYRTEVNVQGGTPKFELKKFCKRERKHTLHKIRRK